MCLIADVGDAPAFLHLQAKRALLHFGAPNELPDAFPCLYFEHPRKVVLRKVAVGGDLVDGYILAYVGEDVINGLVDVSVDYHVTLSLLDGKACMSAKKCSALPMLK